MKRESLKAEVLVGLAAGVVTTALVAVTGTGVAGFYGFGLTAIAIGILWLGWPEIRAARRERGRRGSSQPKAP